MYVLGYSTATKKIKC